MLSAHEQARIALNELASGRIVEPGRVRIGNAKKLYGATIWMRTARQSG
jgi:hypothetical protein